MAARRASRAASSGDFDYGDASDDDAYFIEDDGVESDFDPYEFMEHSKPKAKRAGKSGGGGGRGAAAKKKKSTAKGGGKGGKGAAASGPVNVLELRGLICRATRVDLEKAVEAQCLSGGTMTFPELKIILDPASANAAPALPYDEATAELGSANGLSKELLVDVCGYLGLRDRLRCQAVVCKTWTLWLSEQTDIFKNLKLHIGKWSKDGMWLDSDALLHIISMCPEGSIESFHLTADCKTAKMHKKHHVEAMFKRLSDRFSNLKKLTLFGKKLCKDGLECIAEHCAKNLEEIYIADASADPSSFLRLLRNAPYLTKIEMSGLPTAQFNEIRAACVRARGNGSPLLKVLNAKPKYGYSFEWGSSTSPLNDICQLFTTLPALESLSVGVSLPMEEASMAAVFANVGVPDTLPNVKSLNLAIKGTTNVNNGFYFGFRSMNLTHDNSALLNAFFQKLESLCPNLESLQLESPRAYLSNKDRQRGEVPKSAPCLSGVHRFPNLLSLDLRNIDLDDTFNIDAPELICLSLTGKSAFTEKTFKRMKEGFTKLTKDYYRQTS